MTGAGRGASRGHLSLSGPAVVIVVVFFVEAVAAPTAHAPRTRREAALKGTRPLFRRVRDEAQRRRPVSAGGREQRLLPSTPGNGTQKKKDITHAAHAMNSNRQVIPNLCLSKTTNTHY